MHILNVIINIISLFICFLILKKYLHIYQLKDYNNSRYLKFFIKNHYFYVFLTYFLCIFNIFLKIFILNLIIDIFLILNLFTYNLKIINSNKTPLKQTGRIKNLSAISFAILALFCFSEHGVIWHNLLLIFTPILSNFLNIFDHIKNKKFIRLAQQKLQASKAKIIAITGSNGKTSVKNILFEILSAKYKVQATPKSYNTPLGISKFINEELRHNTEFLILEYGARRKGDIKNLCKIFGADYGIVTTISPQHLESFKSINNIYNTKKELPDYLKTNLCCFNLDNIYTFQMAQNHQNQSTISIHNKANLYAKNIKIINNQTHFDLHFNNKKYQTKTKLLGKHNVSNILLATLLAIKLGIDLTTILETIPKLNPIPHRLELITGKINILDDSYNCSLSSAKEAIEVLMQMSGKKVVATPGIVEGGKNEYFLNFQLGKYCSHVDLCIIIGNHNKKAILDGLKSQNFKHYILCNTLEEAKTHFLNLNIGDTLLLLNDLPDDYN